MPPLRQNTQKRIHMVHGGESPPGTAGTPRAGQRSLAAGAVLAATALLAAAAFLAAPAAGGQWSGLQTARKSDSLESFLHDRLYAAEDAATKLPVAAPLHPVSLSSTVKAACECVAEAGATGIPSEELGCHTSPRSGNDVCYVSSECSEGKASSQFVSMRVKPCVKQAAAAVEAEVAATTAAPAVATEEVATTIASVPSAVSVPTTVVAVCECMVEAGMSSVPAEELGCHTSPRSGKDVCYVGMGCSEAKASSHYAPLRVRPCVKEAAVEAAASTVAPPAVVAASTPAAACECIGIAGTTGIPTEELGCHTSPRSGHDVCYVSAECAGAKASSHFSPLRVTPCVKQAVVVAPTIQTPQLGQLASALGNALNGSEGLSAVANMTGEMASAAFNGTETAVNAVSDAGANAMGGLAKNAAIGIDAAFNATGDLIMEGPSALLNATKNLFKGGPLGALNATKNMFSGAFAKAQHAMGSLTGQEDEATTTVAPPALSPSDALQPAECRCIGVAGDTGIPTAELGCHKSPRSGRNVCYVGPNCTSAKPSSHFRPLRVKPCVMQAAVAASVPPTVAPPTVAPPAVAPKTVAPPAVSPPAVAPPAAVQLAASEGGTVNARLTLDRDISTISDGTDARVAFVHDFKKSVAAALQISADRVFVTAISGGSVIVDFAVAASPEAVPYPTGFLTVALARGVTVAGTVLADGVTIASAVPAATAVISTTVPPPAVVAVADGNTAKLQVILKLLEAKRVEAASINSTTPTALAVKADALKQISDIEAMVLTMSGTPGQIAVTAAGERIENRTRQQIKVDYALSKAACVTQAGKVTDRDGLMCCNVACSACGGPECRTQSVPENACCASVIMGSMTCSETQGPPCMLKLIPAKEAEFMWQSVGEVPVSAPQALGAQLGQLQSGLAAAFGGTESKAGNLSSAVFDDIGGGVGSAGNLSVAAFASVGAGLNFSDPNSTASAVAGAVGHAASAVGTAAADGIVDVANATYHGLGSAAGAAVGGLDSAIRSTADIANSVASATGDAMVAAANTTFHGSAADIVGVATHFVIFAANGTGHFVTSAAGEAGHGIVVAANATEEMFKSTTNAAVSRVFAPASHILVFSANATGQFVSSELGVAGHGIVVAANGTEHFFEDAAVGAAGVAQEGAEEVYNASAPYGRFASVVGHDIGNGIATGAGVVGHEAAVAGRAVGSGVATGAGTVYNTTAPAVRFVGDGIASGVATGASFVSNESAIIGNGIMAGAHAMGNESVHNWEKNMAGIKAGAGRALNMTAPIAKAIGSGVSLGAGKFWNVSGIGIAYQATAMAARGALNSTLVADKKVLSQPTGDIAWELVQLAVVCALVVLVLFAAAKMTGSMQAKGAGMDIPRDISRQAQYGSTDEFGVAAENENLRTSLRELRKKEAERVASRRVEEANFDRLTDHEKWLAAYDMRDKAAES